MIYPDYIRAVASHARHTGVTLALASLSLICPAAALARQAAPPRAPSAAPVAPAQAPAPPARAAAPRRAPIPAVVPPREVVTVVHRLSGWKLLAWLATSGPSAVVLD